MGHIILGAYLFSGRNNLELTIICLENNNNDCSIFTKIKNLIILLFSQADPELVVLLRERVVDMVGPVGDAQVFEVAVP